MFSHNRRFDAPTGVEKRAKAHKTRLDGTGQVIQDLVGHGFMEGTGIPERPDIKFKRFQFDTPLVWNILEV